MTTDIYALKCNGGGKKMGKQTVTNCITTILSYAEFVQQDYYCRDEDSLNYVFILEKISDDFNFLCGKSYRTEYKEYVKTIEKGNRDESHMADMYLCYLEMEIQNCLEKLKNQINLMLCETDNIYDMEARKVMLEYSDALFEYIAVFRNSTGVRRIRDASRLLKAIAGIRENDTLSKIMQQ